MKAFENGIRLQFADALDPEWAGNPNNFAIEQWNYRYSKDYGSKDYSVVDPDKEGRDTVKILSVELSSDQHSVFLSLEKVAPVMQIAVRYNLRSQERDRVRGAVYYTVNKPRPAYR